MILIETSKYKTFESYLKSLSKPARKNWKFAKKHNEGVKHIEATFNKTIIQDWMDLWGNQLIRGHYRQFAFTADALEGKNIICFEAFDQDYNTIAYQFVEETEGYINCHPVMYEKEKYQKRYLSKFMWFSLIKWAIENKIKIVDMGGGNDDSWREMIKTRDQYPNPAYKWLYVPQSVKEHPEKQNDYKVEHYGISKRIFKIN